MPGLIYNFLSDISPVDYYPDADRPGRFAVSYHIYSMLYNRRLRVKAYLQEDEPVISTVSDIWPAANWLEREAYDMMGITFEGHPYLKRILMPEDWDGHPHRRDYPLGYETIQFSFNAEEIQKHKPLAKA
jgi:NADH-quinone oxidoreductase subunit C